MSGGPSLTLCFNFRMAGSFTARPNLRLRPSPLWLHDLGHAVAEKTGLSVRDILSQTVVINFGTTVATNAMLQSKGVKVGMVTTGGIRDIVELRRGWKEVMFDIKLPPPTTIVPRRWRLTVAERVAVDGSIVQPLDEETVRDHARRFRAAGINSIAVFIISGLNTNGVGVGH
jgi:N-methylhydantoinase A